MMKIFAITVVASAVSGCGDLDKEITDTACAASANEGDVSVSVATTPTFVTGAMSVKLRGEASHALGLAIRRVTVAGLDTTSDSFNFAAWSIDVPGDLIVATLGDDALPVTIHLAVVAYDVCNGGAAAGATTAKVIVTGP